MYYIGIIFIVLIFFKIFALVINNFEKKKAQLKQEKLELLTKAVESHYERHPYSGEMLLIERDSKLHLNETIIEFSKRIELEKDLWNKYRQDKCTSCSK